MIFFLLLLRYRIKGSQYPQQEQLHRIIKTILIFDSMRCVAHACIHSISYIYNESADSPNILSSANVFLPLNRSHGVLKKSPPHSDVLNKKEMDRTTEAGACFQPIHQSSRTWKGHVDVICSTASQLLQSRADVKAGCGFESSRLLRASLGLVPKTSKDGDFTAPCWTPFHYKLW